MDREAASWAGHFATLVALERAEGASVFLSIGHASGGYWVGRYIRSLTLLPDRHVEPVEMSSGVQTWEITGSTDQ